MTNPLWSHRMCLGQRKLSVQSLKRLNFSIYQLTSFLTTSSHTIVTIFYSKYPVLYFNINWKLIDKAASMKVNLLTCLHQFILPSQTVNSVQRPYPHIYEIRWKQKLFVLPPLIWLMTAFCLFLIVALLHLLLSFSAIFMVTAILILLTACLPSSHGVAAQDFLFSWSPYCVHLPIAGINQYSHSFIPFFGKP